MSDQDGLVFAYALDGKGGARPLDWDGIRTADGSRGEDRNGECFWVHLERNGTVGRHWAETASGIDSVVVDTLYGEAGISLALWQQDSHPHIVEYGNGLVVHLRGVDLNPDADPNDMISIRAWIEPNLIVTVRERHVRAVQDIRESLEAGTGPNDPGKFLNLLISRLIDRIAEAVVDLSETTDALEDELIARVVHKHRQRLAEIRRRAIAKRRHLLPQREALYNLRNAELKWISARDRVRLSGSADRLARQVEDIESIRERTTVMQDEILNHLATQSNRTTYILAVVATVFLPISFLTGLFGVNLGGIPGTDVPWGFSAGVTVLLFIALVEIWLFRRLKWF